jgi:hypothetical protein
MSFLRVVGALKCLVIHGYSNFKTTGFPNFGTVISKDNTVLQGHNMQSKSVEK